MMRTRCYPLAAVLCLLLFLQSCNRVDPQRQLEPVLERYVAYWNSGNLDGIETVVHPEFELYMSPDFSVRIGLDSLKQEIMRTKSSFPDFHVKLDEVMYTEGRAAGLWTLTATGPSSADGRAEKKRVVVKGMSFLHFKDGKVKDEWIVGNDLAWLMQLGYEVKKPQ